MAVNVQPHTLLRAAGQQVAKGPDFNNWAILVAVFLAIQRSQWIIYFLAVPKCFVQSTLTPKDSCWLPLGDITLISTDPDCGGFGGVSPGAASATTMA